jgi:hypothetical protein
MPLPTTFASDSSRGEGQWRTISSGPAPIGAPFFYETANLQTGYPNVVSALSAAVDTNGNVFSLIGIGSPIITKYNSSGVLQWQYQTTGGQAAGNGAITVDSLGNVIVVMSMNGTTAGTTGDMMIFKLNNDGGNIWQVRLVANGNSSPQVGNVVTDSSNNIYFCGGIGGNDNTRYGFIAKLNSSGVKLNSFTAGVSNGAGFRKMQIDSNGVVYAIDASTGVFWKLTSSLAPYYTASTSSFRISSAGQSTIAVDKLNNVWIGYYTNSTPTGYFAALGTKWDGTTVNTSGIPTVSTNISFYNSWNNSTTYDITCDNSNNVYLCGSTYYNSSPTTPMSFISGFSSNGSQLPGFPVGLRSNGSIQSGGNYNYNANISTAVCDISNNIYCTSWNFQSESFSTNSKGTTFYSYSYYPVTTKFPTSSITSKVSFSTVYGSSPTTTYYNSSSDTGGTTTFTAPSFVIDSTSFPIVTNVSFTVADAGGYSGGFGTGTANTQPGGAYVGITKVILQ